MKKKRNCAFQQCSDCFDLDKYGVKQELFNGCEPWFFLCSVYVHVWRNVYKSSQVNCIYTVPNYNRIYHF